MKLYNPQTQELAPNRTHVPAGWIVLKEIRLPRPEGNVRPHVVIDDDAKTMTYSWQIITPQEEAMMASLFPPPSSNPDTVTMVSLKLALDAAGMFNNIEAAVFSASNKFKILWTNPTAARNNPDLIKFATDLGLTSKQIDDLFAAAKQLDNS